jgi:hypothetical protein
MKAFGFSLCLALSAGYFAILLPICSARPAPAQQPAARNSLNGTWINVDPATRGIVRIQINGEKVHPYGACHPDLCDWGVLKAKSFASTVDSKNSIALLTKKKTSFNQSQLTLALGAGGKLRVEVLTHFTDGSGRTDYRTVDTFARNLAAYVP